MFNLFWATNLRTAFRSFQSSQQPKFRHKKHENLVKVECKGKKPLIKLDCKTALITGGSDGIGLAVAHELLSEKVKNIALLGIDNNRGRDSVRILNNTYGKDKTVFFNCDVQCKVRVEECYTMAVKEFGNIDIVVNAAGVFDELNWEKELMTNLVGTINSTMAAQKFMSKECKGTGGVILNFSGIHGFKPLFPAPVLSASQHGIIGLSRSFGNEINFKNTGIRLVTLCTGITNTDFFKEAEKKVTSDRHGNEIHAILKNLKRQEPDACGKSAIHVLKYGPSGSIWVVEGSRLYDLQIPHWKKYRTLQSQLI